MKQSTKIKIVNLIKKVLRYEEPSPVITQYHTSPVEHLQFKGYIPVEDMFPKTYVKTKILDHISDFIFETNGVKSPFHIEINKDGNFDKTILAEYKVDLHFINDEIYCKAAKEFIL